MEHLPVCWGLEKHVMHGHKPVHALQAIDHSESVFFRAAILRIGHDKKMVVIDREVFPVDSAETENDHSNTDHDLS